MEQSRFVYVTYISTSEEDLWKAIVVPEITRRYWQHQNVSDWQPGSKWEHRRSDNGDILLVGKIIESSPPRRLVMTWAEPADELNDEKHSRVTFEIEQAVSDVVRLTVTHDQLEAGSQMLQDIMEGWPKVLSSLKSMLETGQPLPTLW